MRIPFILCTLFTLCISGTTQAMLSRVFPLLVPAARTSYTQVRPYNEEELVQQIHKNQAHRYLRAIKDPEHDTECDQDICKAFLSRRTIFSLYIFAGLHNISSDPTSPSLPHIFYTEQLLLDPKSEAAQFRLSYYAKTVEDCLVHTVRAQLRCKAPRLNPFERTLGCTTFDVEAFEQQYNINLEAVTWEEQEDRSTALLKAYLNTYCNTGSADDRRHATGGIHHVIRLMRLERSHDLSVAAGKLLSAPQ